MGQASLGSDGPPPIGTALPQSRERSLMDNAPRRHLRVSNQIWLAADSIEQIEDRCEGRLRVTTKDGRRYHVQCKYLTHVKYMARHLGLMLVSS